MDVSCRPSHAGGVIFRNWLAGSGCIWGGLEDCRLLVKGLGGRELQCFDSDGSWHCKWVACVEGMASAAAGRFWQVSMDLQPTWSCAGKEMVARGG